MFCVLFLFQLNAQQIQLRLICGRGAFRHGFGGVFELGICDDVSQALRADHLHYKAVKPQRAAAVGRRAEAESV